MPQQAAPLPGGQGLLEAALDVRQVCRAGNIHLQPGALGLQAQAFHRNLDQGAGIDGLQLERDAPRLDA